MVSKLGSQWLPVAIIAAVGSSFFLWKSMNDWERSRYFAMIAGLPIAVAALYGILGMNGRN